MSKNLSKLLLPAALIFSAQKRPTNQTIRMSVHAFAHIHRIYLDLKKVNYIRQSAYTISFKVFKFRPILFNTFVYVDNKTKKNAITNLKHNLNC